MARSTVDEIAPDIFRIANFAPDGRRAAVLNGSEIWIVDLVRSVPMRFATSSSSTPSTVWSPDGNRIAFISKHDGREEIHIAGLDGRADPVPTTDDPFKAVWDWSRDGRYIVFSGLSAETGWDLWLLPLNGDRKPVPYLRGTAWEMFGRISPDGRWLAYQSNETGQTGQAEVYVQSFPEPGRKVRVSLDGGAFPRWADGGRQLEYNSGGAVIAVPVKEGEEFQPGSPRKLFTMPRDATSGAIVGDGSRTLVGIATGRRPRDVRIVIDWTAMVGR